MPGIWASLSTCPSIFSRIFECVVAKIWYLTFLTISLTFPGLQRGCHCHWKLHESCGSSNKVQTSCLGAILTRTSHTAFEELLIVKWFIIVWRLSESGKLSFQHQKPIKLYQQSHFEAKIKQILFNSNNSHLPIKWSYETSFNNFSVNRMLGKITSS